MRDIFIIGISGFIGQHLLEELTKSNEFSIKGLTRKKSLSLNNLNPNFRFIQGDILCPDEFIDKIESDSIVINLAFLNNRSSEVNKQAIINLLEICIKRNAKRLIHCSTAIVAGRSPDAIVTEQTDCNPGNEYEKTKYLLEQIITEGACNRFPVTILRPTAVFGENGENLLKLANEVRRGNRFINYLKTSLFHKRKMNLVAVENVVAAIKFLIDIEQSGNKEVYIISDDDNEKNNYQYIKTFLSRRLNPCHSNPPIIKLPLFILSNLQRLFRKSSVNPLQNYCSQKLYLAGFKRKVTLEAALENFAEWYITKETELIS